MTLSIPHTVLNIPEHPLEELINLAGSYPVPGWHFIDWPYGNLNLSVLGPNSALRRFMSDVSHKLRSSGFVVVGLAPLVDLLPEATSAAAITLLLSAIGLPLHVFLSYPHWRELKADLSRPPQRSGGIGATPLHLDFVNAEDPPDYTCLLCLRPDPLGGGKSLIASIKGIERLLKPTDIEILSRHQFRDGVVINLSGVGHDVNPFPVIELNAPWKYRFTGNLLSSTADPGMRNALQTLAAKLHSKTVSFTLQRGELLILDQHQFTHARGELGEGQDNIPESERRLLLLSYLRELRTF